MEKLSAKKITISYLMTTAAIFVLTAITNMLGLFGKDPATNGMSLELLVLVQLTVVIIANLILHLFFYLGGFKSSPIAKGVGIGAVIGVAYFLTTVFLFNAYDINSEAVATLISAAAGRILEYTTGGVMTAVISVSEVHRWGLLKSF